MSKIYTMRLSLCFVLAAINVAAGQKIIAEISTPGGSMRDFQMTSAQDSLLFSYTQTGETPGKMKRSKWIRNDGKSYDTFFAAEVGAIAKSEGGLFYYYIDEVSNASVIKALVVDSVTKAIRTYPAHLMVSGRVLSIYTNENLFIVTYREDENQVVVQEISGLDIVREVRYDLPVRLSDYLPNASHPEFFRRQSSLNGFMGHAKVKVYQYDHLYITIDEPYMSSGNNLDDPQTQVLICRGENDVEQMIFAKEGRSDFRSYILDGMLFRNSISRQRFLLTIHDLKSRRLLAREEIVKDQTDFKVYVRSGKDNEINRDGSFRKMMASSWLCEPSLVVNKNQRDRYIIQWGTYNNEKGAVGPGSLGISPAGIFMMIAGTTLKQLGEGPGLRQYFYYEWRNDNTFALKPDSIRIIRQVIDDYEIGLAGQKSDFQYKGYIDHHDGVVGVYYDWKKDKATLVYFE